MVKKQMNRSIIEIWKGLQCFTLVPLIVLFLLFDFHSLNAQHVFSNGNEAAADSQANNESLDSFIAYYQINKGLKSTSEYVIPTVVHIIHNNGVENISDSEVTNAIALLNEQFNGNFGGYDCDIKFQLAKIDPDGNCTTGITRTVYGTPQVVDGATPSQISTLEALVASGKSGSQHASALLEVLTGFVPLEEYNLPGGGGGLKSLKVRDSVRRPSLVGVYPNPAQGEFYITYVLPTECKSALIHIFDLQGKLVQSENVTSGYGILSLNAKYFAAGIYVFELELDGQKVATEKFQIVE